MLYAMRLMRTKSLIPLPTISLGFFINTEKNIYCIHMFFTIGGVEKTPLFCYPKNRTNVCISVPQVIGTIRTDGSKYMSLITETQS